MNWKRWIRPGAVLTFAVALVAVLVRFSGMENDIAGRALAELSGEGQGWAEVSVSGRDVTIRGLAPSTEAQEQAAKAVRRLSAVRAVNNQSELLPILSPYVWQAAREGPGVTLSGAVPSEGARAAVLAAARRALPEAEIRDAMNLARGAPAAFGTATAFGLARLTDLAEGRVTLTDTTLAISGTAADAQKFAEVKASLASDVPPVVALGPIDILPARANPFVWSIAYDGKSVRMVGFVPNDIVRETLLGTAKAALPGVAILDTLTVASGAPPGFVEAATFAISTMDRMKEGGVTLDGLNLDVSGSAKTVEDYEALLAALNDALPDGVKVVSAAIEPAEVATYGWQGERSEAGVVLSGYVPSIEARDDVVAAARLLLGGVKVDDRIRVAAGEPRMDWVGAIKFALGELARLRTGKVALGGKSFAVSGEAASAEDYSALIETNAKTLPASLSLAQNEIAAPRVGTYRFVAERTAKGVAISGNAPGETDREEIMTSLARKFGHAEVSGALAYASGAPAGYVQAVQAAVQALNRMAGGRVEIANTDLTVRGFAYRPSGTEEIPDGLTASLPDGFKIDAIDVQARQEDQMLSGKDCRDHLQAALQTGRITFDGNKAEIATDSDGVLDRVGAVLARCPETQIEVGAYTDNVGTASRNRDRTQARAEAIVDYLVTAGIKRERLVAVGYGEDNPIADNKTEAGRDANRRIEFKVAVPDAG